jgi:cysteine desulfurase
MNLFGKKRIYLDYASATPLAPEVAKVVREYSEYFYNPSSLYTEGVNAHNELARMRKNIAKLLHVSHRDIVFTSGGTESDNLAIFGVVESAKEKIEKPHVITLTTEHPAILETAIEAKRRGAGLTILETDVEGKIDPAEIRNALKDTTVLVTLSYASSEVGTMQHIGKIGRIIRQFRKERGTAYPYLHVDASQAIHTNEIDPEAMNADLVTLDGAKIYGPKGIGLLVVRPNVSIRPLILGGGQEKGLRSGTENLSAIAGLNKALEILEERREDDRKNFKKLRKLFISLLEKEIPEAALNGARENSLEHIASIRVPGKLHEFLAIKLDREGVLVSTGSSCSTNKNEDDKEALRFSFGRNTTENEIKTAIRTLRSILV